VSVIDRTAVPFMDLRGVHAPLSAGVLADVAALIDSSAFVNGPAVAEFERAWARWCGARRCVGVASGLDALRLGLLASGLEPGEEVIVPANTFVATVEAIMQAGGRPVIADVSPADYNLDPAAAAGAVGSRTRALLPVHLYGQLADGRALGALARHEGLVVVEDACQAHGARRDGLRAGWFGSAAAFSFYPGKNLGAMGDAGALVTGEDAVADEVTARREHGQRVKNHHELEGYTARLDTIQALVLLRKLPLLAEWTEERRRLAAAYTERLSGVGDLVLPPVPAGSRPAWHLYPVRTADPEALGATLTDAGVATGRHYPVPVHLAPAYAGLGHRRGEFPVAEALAAQLLSLPLYPGLREEQLEAVIAAVRGHFDG
jgi:dTDP-3-amino-3,4,6-trideoxy-alpha-D-glucose transaminase